MTNLQFSTDDVLTKEVCEQIGFDFAMQFIATAKDEDGRIYVTATAGRHEEWQQARSSALRFGYGFLGLSGKISRPVGLIFDRRLKEWEDQMEADLGQMVCYDFARKDYARTNPRPRQF